jgi:hypothetical protein
LTDINQKNFSEIIEKPYWKLTYDSNTNGFLIAEVIKRQERLKAKASNQFFCWQPKLLNMAGARPFPKPRARFSSGGKLSIPKRRRRMANREFLSPASISPVVKCFINS